MTHVRITVVNFATNKLVFAYLYAVTSLIFLKLTKSVINTGSAKSSIVYNGWNLAMSRMTNKQSATTKSEKVPDM